MESRVQRVLIWTGPLMVLIWFAVFVWMGWFPPSEPSSTAEEIEAIYADRTTTIKLGLIIVMAASTLLVTWSGAIAGAMWRIKGAKVLMMIQLVSCAVLSLEFITPIGIWMTAVYRFDGDARTAGITEALHDMGWILFVTVIWSVCMQLGAIAAAIFIDRAPDPFLPRWLGYMTAWAALLIMPAGMILFFKDGPFAWNGIIGLYIPLTAFAVWILIFSYKVHVRLTERIALEDAESAGNAGDVSH